MPTSKSSCDRISATTSMYLGEVDADGKRELLASATALLNPISWREPFGMAMLESLACGTPVVGCPQGAAPEIVEHGVTGFLGDTDAELARGCARSIGSTVPSAASRCGSGSRSSEWSRDMCVCTSASAAGTRESSTATTP